MKPDLLDQSIIDMVNRRCKALEEKVQADVVFYNGSIYPEYFNLFRDFVEEVKRSSRRKENTVSIVLRTAGGSAETTERMVGVLRHHYEYVHFIVPDVAYSAGTIFVFSGDRIFMDYGSSLGPIDPQVPIPDSQEYVPAMGYLDKVKEITSKGELAEADVVLLRSIDLAKLALFEQARDLSIDLLTNWLVKYKFKDWKTHRTNRPGAPVTEREKRRRAESIARCLADHKMWKSHGRSLDIQKLKELRVEVDDYSHQEELREAIRAYNDPLTGYIDRHRWPLFLHSHHVTQ